MSFEMQPENLPGTSEIYRILANNGMVQVGSYGAPASSMSSYVTHEAPTFPGSFLGAEIAGGTELPQARGLAAARNHKEAEKRRRERINSHLNELRKLLPCNSKTDKASLLARVVQHVRELKQRTSEMSGLELLPTESDEIAVFSDEVSVSGEGRSVFRATLCCEDRSDLIPDLIDTLKSLRLKTLRAEIATIGGRVRNVLVVAGEDDDFHGRDAVSFLRDALRTLVERSGPDRSKRRRTFERRISPD